MIFRLGYTKEGYQSIRNDAVRQNFGQVFPTFGNIRDYCKQHCRPVIQSNDNMTWSSVQANADHQLRRQMEFDPKLKSECVTLAQDGWSLYKVQKGGLGTIIIRSKCNIEMKYLISINSISSASQISAGQTCHSMILT